MMDGGLPQHSRTAFGLLTRMRRTAAGWTFTDLDRLYAGFGFVRRDGGAHTVYRHPDHPSLRAVVPRHRGSKSWVVRDAVQLVDELLRCEKARRDERF